MVLMAMDHVDGAVNARHVSNDGAMFPVNTYDAVSFIPRWCTHLCAPTFILLAGVSIALSADNARRRGTSWLAIDRHLVTRGLVIIAIELLLVSHYWQFAEGTGLGLLPLFPLVLWAIGGCMVLIAPLRHAPTAALLTLAATVLVGIEYAQPTHLFSGQSLLTTVFVTGGIWFAEPPTAASVPAVITVYPMLAWLPVMIVGLVLGQGLVAGRLTPRWLFATGAIGLAAFAILRGLNGWGNMGLHRQSNALLEWLHCSKYPPSMAFLSLEIGLSLLVLGAFMAAERVLARLPERNPLTVFGRVPMFYYLVHLPLIGLLVTIGPLPGQREGTVIDTLWGTPLVVALCWPLCLAYGAYKRRWQHAWTRYL